MTRRRSQEPPPIEVKDFTPEEIEQGITKLRRRLEEVRALDPIQVRYDDTRVSNVESNLREAIREVFGSQSPEFREHQYHNIWHGGIQMMDSETGMQRKFAEGIPQTVTMLEGLIARLEEKRLDLDVDPSTRARASLQSLSIHPRIADVSTTLYNDGHYSEAVFAASKALINMVKEESGRHDLDGASLMRTVFSRNNPVLAFNNLQDQSDMDEQEGMMHLFEGAVLAIRNPRAHSFYSDSPDRALEYIALLSMLANRLEGLRQRP